MFPPRCIEGGKAPCPTCEVSQKCDWGLSLMIHDPVRLGRKVRSLSSRIFACPNCNGTGQVVKEA